MPEVKKPKPGFFEINAQINAYLAKELSVTSINSSQAAGKYDTRAGTKVGSRARET